MQASIRSRLTGERAPSWRGGRHVGKAGYICIWEPSHPKANGNYVLEHRLVMEKSIGRYLVGRETVHHRNGNRVDNRIENLELYASNHGVGHKYTDLSLQELEAMRDWYAKLAAERRALLTPLP